PKFFQEFSIRISVITQPFQNYPCPPSAAQSNLDSTACFSSSKPSPVTEEIFTKSKLFFLHQRWSFWTFFVSATSILAATTILGFFGKSGLYSASSESIA